MSSFVFDLDKLIEDQKKYNARLDNALTKARTAPAQNLFARYGICLSESKTYQQLKTKPAQGLPPPVAPGKFHAFTDLRLLWTTLQDFRNVLTVGFLDGSDQDHAIVKKTVQEWLLYPDKIGIDFKFVDPSNQEDTDNADVRISFKRNNQSFSYVGINCRSIEKGQETMHLGWDVSTDYGRATVLHEFGHALGLFHEHQSPFGAQKKIHWVEDVVIEDCLRSQGWSEEETRAQILSVEPMTKSMIGTVYDPKSIMHYRFPPEWTEEGYDQPANLTLSSLDKSFIRQCYPLVPKRDIRPGPSGPGGGSGPSLPAGNGPAGNGSAGLQKVDSRSGMDQRNTGGVDKKQKKNAGGNRPPAGH